MYPSMSMCVCVCLFTALSLSSALSHARPLHLFCADSVLNNGNISKVLLKNVITRRLDYYRKLTFIKLFWLL